MPAPTPPRPRWCVYTGRVRAGVGAGPLTYIVLVSATNLNYETHKRERSMATKATIVVTIEGWGGNTHVLKVDPDLWAEDSEAVMSKLREAIAGIAGQPVRYDIRASRVKTGDVTAVQEHLEP
jgi:hypothetical protein